MARSTFYYEPKDQPKEEHLTEAIVNIFHKNRQVYGTRKIKIKLQDQGFSISRRKIGRIMDLFAKGLPLR